MIAPDSSYGSMYVRDRARAYSPRTMNGYAEQYVRPPFGEQYVRPPFSGFGADLDWNAIIGGVTGAVGQVASALKPQINPATGQQYAIGQSPAELENARLRAAAAAGAQKADNTLMYVAGGVAALGVLLLVLKK